MLFEVALHSRQSNTLRIISDSAHFNIPVVVPVLAVSTVAAVT